MRAKQIKSGILGGAIIGCGLWSSSANASLLYQWNMDVDGGTGTIITPSVTPNGLATDGGVLTMAQAKGSAGPVYTPTNLYTAAGGGTTGGASDYAFDNSTSVSNNPNPGGIAFSTGAADPNNANTVNAMPNVTQYTITMWVKPTTAELGVQSRLFQIATAPGFDESTNGLWVALNAGKVQTGGSSSNANSGGTGNLLVANAWNFIAVEVDLAAPNVFFDPAMQAATGRNDSFQLYQGDATSATYGYTAQNGFANGTTTFASQGDYVQLLNRSSNANRAFQGQADDFRIYNELLTTAQLQGIIAADTSVPEPTSLAAIVCAAGVLVSRRRR